MLTHRELKAMKEWQVIGGALGDLFAEHTRLAISEERDISIVRYHKGWIDAINEFIDMFERLFPEPDRDEPIGENTLAGESIIAARKDGSVY